jgi:hypothetical protein
MPVDEQVDGAGLTRYAGRVESGAGDLQHPGTDPAGDACGSKGGQVRVARKTRVERFQLLGRVQEQRQRGWAVAQIHLDLAVQELQPGAIQRVQRPGGGPREQAQGFLGGAGQLLAGGGFQRAAGPAGGVGREHRRSLEKRSGGRESAPCADALGGLLQLTGDVLIGLRDRVRAMPGAAIGVELGIGGCR